MQINMILLLFTLLILSYYFGAKYTSLTVKIEYLRGNISEQNYEVGIYDFYKFPIPYFSEPNDSDEIKKMIKRRGLFVGLFWICFISFIVICIIESPPSNHNK